MKVFNTCQGMQSFVTGRENFLKQKNVSQKAKPGKENQSLSLDNFSAAQALIEPLCTVDLD